MSEVIETEKWHIFIKNDLSKPLDESYIELIFRLKSDPTGIKGTSEEDLDELRADIKDLGKWRKFKELKKDLEGIK